MKRVIIILEGASESGDAELRSDTPLHAARTPALDALARHARLGTARMTPEDSAPGAEVSLAATLGIDPLRFSIGRGPAEALAYGLEIGRSDALLRASLVTVDDGILSDWAPEPLRLAEVRGFLHAINTDAPEGAEVLCGDGHRCILAVRNSTACRAVQTLSPVEVMGKPVRAHLPFGRGSRALAKWMQQAMTRLEGHELNHIRADLGEPEVTGVWFWGAGEIPRIPSWRDRFGVGGELITSCALMQGSGGWRAWTWTLGNPGRAIGERRPRRSQVERSLRSIDGISSVFIQTGPTLPGTAVIAMQRSRPSRLATRSWSAP